MHQWLRAAQTPLVFAVPEIVCYITHPMAPRKTTRKKTPPEPLHFRGFPLTTGDSATLARLSLDASDCVGRTISQSAIVRALVRHAGRQGEQWLQEHILPHLESEIDAGVLWGKKPGAG